MGTRSGDHSTHTNMPEVGTLVSILQIRRLKWTFHTQSGSKRLSYHRLLKYHAHYYSTAVRVYCGDWLEDLLQTHCLWMFSPWCRMICYTVCIRVHNANSLTVKMLWLGKMMGDGGSVHIQFRCCALPHPNFSICSWLDWNCRIYRYKEPTALLVMNVIISQVDTPGGIV